MPTPTSTPTPAQVEISVNTETVQTELIDGFPRTTLEWIGKFFEPYNDPARDLMRRLQEPAKPIAPPKPINELKRAQLIRMVEKLQQQMEATRTENMKLKEANAKANRDLRSAQMKVSESTSQITRIQRTVDDLTAANTLLERRVNTFTSQGFSTGQVAEAINAMLRSHALRIVATNDRNADAATIIQYSEASDEGTQLRLCLQNRVRFSLDLSSSTSSVPPTSSFSDEAGIEF